MSMMLSCHFAPSLARKPVALQWRLGLLGQGLRNVSPRHQRTQIREHPHAAEELDAPQQVHKRLFSSSSRKNATCATLETRWWPLPAWTTLFFLMMPRILPNPHSRRQAYTVKTYTEGSDPFHIQKGLTLFTTTRPARRTSPAASRRRFRNRPFSSWCP